MSRSRSRLDLDYAILNSSGRRVLKVRGTKGNQKENMADLDIQALNASSDFDDFLDSYNIGGLVDEDELSEYVNRIGEIKRTFRRVYTQIKKTEGEGFDTKYPNYDNELRDISVKFQEANKKLSELRKEKKAQSASEEKIRNDLETEKLVQEMAAMKKLGEEKRSQAIQEWKFRVDQVFWFIGETTWETKNDVDDIQHVIFTLKSYLSQVSKACAELKGILGDDANDFIEENEKVVSKTRDHIKLGTARLQCVREEKLIFQEALAEKEANEKLQAEEERVRKKKYEEGIKIQNLMACAQSLEYEIKNRYDALKHKFSMDLNALSDYEILDLKKREDSFNSELREILDKISSLLQYVVPCGNQANSLRENVKTMRDDITLETQAFIESVNKTVSDRDISEKKS